MGLTSWLRRAWRARDRRVVALGLRGAHERAVAALPAGAPVAHEAGFSIHTLAPHGGLTFIVKCLSGSDERRPLWPHHYAGTAGVLFVVDADAEELLAPVAQELASLAADRQLEGVPVAVLFTSASSAVAEPACGRLADRLGLRERFALHAATGDPPAALAFLARHSRAL
jgi:hypothetical protein